MVPATDNAVPQAYPGIISTVGSAPGRIWEAFGSAFVRLGIPGRTAGRDTQAVSIGWKCAFWEAVGQWSRTKRDDGPVQEALDNHSSGRESVVEGGQIMLRGSGPRMRHHRRCIREGIAGNASRDERDGHRPLHISSCASFELTRVAALIFTRVSPVCPNGARLKKPQSGLNPD
jgi:hypothetical protein